MYMYTRMCMYMSVSVFVFVALRCVAPLAMLTWKPFIFFCKWSQRLTDPPCCVIPSRVSLRIAGDEQLSTCNANDQRNRERVFLDLISNIKRA